jgi:hypothetical protein
MIWMEQKDLKVKESRVVAGIYIEKEVRTLRKFHGRASYHITKDVLSQKHC